MYNLSSYAQKLIAMAMSSISIDGGKYSVAFRTEDFIKTMGLEARRQGANTKDKIKAAVKECLKNTVDIQMPGGRWKGHTWFSECALHKADKASEFGWEFISMTFNPALGDVVKELKRGFSKIDIAKLVKLQSKYAIRYYRLAVSYAGFAGRDKNPPGQWYIEMSLAEIRLLFRIEEKKYKATKDFRVKVIDEPIGELNAADTGIQIKIDYIRRGRYLTGVRLNCRRAKRKAARPPAPEEAGQGDGALAAAHPEEFAEYKARALEEKLKNPGIYAAYPEMLEKAAEGAAMQKLKEKHPEITGRPETPAKTPRRRKTALGAGRAQ